MFILDQLFSTIQKEQSGITTAPRSYGSTPAASTGLVIRWTFSSVKWVARGRYKVRCFGLDDIHDLWFQVSLLRSPEWPTWMQDDKVMLQKRVCWRRRSCHRMQGAIPMLQGSISRKICWLHLAFIIFLRSLWTPKSKDANQSSTAATARSSQKAVASCARSATAHGVPSPTSATRRITTLSASTTRRPSWPAWTCWTSRMANRARGTSLRNELKTLIW